jgi:hypothetical protein
MRQRTTAAEIAAGQTEQPELRLLMSGVADWESRRSPGKAFRAHDPKREAEPGVLRSEA